MQAGAATHRDILLKIAAATSTANRTLTIARFIVGSSFPHMRLLFPS